MRRLLLAVLALLAGCGSGEPPQPAEAARVRATVVAYRDAVAARDYDTLCRRVLAPALIARLDRAGFPCEPALRRFLGATRRPRLRILGVRVRGIRARVGVQTSAAGQARVEASLGLVRLGGSWRVADLSLPEPPR